MKLSQRFEEALRYAALIHAGQQRRGVPFLAHLLAVASLSLEHGASEDQAIASLLHDAAEKAGGGERLEDIRGRFGGAVAEIVDGCTDSYEEPKPAWRARKAAYIARLGHVADPVRLVSAADKLHNCRAIVSEWRRRGDRVWDELPGRKDGTIWYYRCLLQAFRKTGTEPILDELEEAVAALEQAASAGQAATP